MGEPLFNLNELKNDEKVKSFQEEPLLYNLEDHDEERVIIQHTNDAWNKRLWEELVEDELMGL